MTLNIIQQQQEIPEPILKTEVIEFCDQIIDDLHPHTLKIARDLVQPHLAETGFEFPMDGKECHLSADAPPLAHIAARALKLATALPFVEANGNAMEVKHVAMALGLFSIPFMYPLTNGKPLADAVAGFAKHKNDRKKSRQGKRKLKDVPAIILEGAYVQSKGKKNWLQQVTDRVNNHLIGEKVCSKSVREELRIRGILE
jgi:hypothetical protein